LTKAEIDLIEKLPGPPRVAGLRTTNVWIVEWLFVRDEKTGRLLHEWIHERRPGWSAYSSYWSKAEVLAAIDRAAAESLRSGMIPVLHIEAHGDKLGLGGPEGKDHSGFITWDDLTLPLQRLNMATRCNLMIFVAACTGFAAINTFTGGPHAPAVFLAGPDGRLTGSSLLAGTKELYRGLMGGTPGVSAILEDASREMEPVTFEPEPFAVLAFESLAESLVVFARQEELRRRTERVRWHMQSTGVKEHKDRTLRSVCADELQRRWDELFFIDRWSENRERFGVDMAKIVDMVFNHQEAHCRG